MTSEFVGFVDQTTRAMLSPVERLKKLLESKDKRAMILEMVDKDELDLNLMALLKTNINTAKQQAGGRSRERVPVHVRIRRWSVSTHSIPIQPCIHAGTHSFQKPPPIFKE